MLGPKVDISMKISLNNFKSALFIKGAYLTGLTGTVAKSGIFCSNQCSTTIVKGRCA